MKDCIVLMNANIHTYMPAYIHVHMHTGINVTASGKRGILVDFMENTLGIIRMSSQRSIMGDNGGFIRVSCRKLYAKSTDFT